VPDGEKSPTGVPRLPFSLAAAVRRFRPRCQKSPPRHPNEAVDEVANRFFACTATSLQDCGYEDKNEVRGRRPPRNRWLPSRPAPVPEGPGQLEDIVDIPGLTDTELTCQDGRHFAACWSPAADPRSTKGDAENGPSAALRNDLELWCRAGSPAHRPEGKFASVPARRTNAPATPGSSPGGDHPGAVGVKRRAGHPAGCAPSRVLASLGWPPLPRPYLAARRSARGETGRVPRPAGAGQLDVESALLVTPPPRPQLHAPPSLQTLHYGVSRR